MTSAVVIILGSDTMSYAPAGPCLGRHVGLLAVEVVSTHQWVSRGGLYKVFGTYPIKPKTTHVKRCKILLMYEEIQ
jgi:hypothetical protein